MFIILPVLFFVLALGLFYRNSLGLREAFLKASCLGGVFIVVITELLSVFHGLCFQAVLLSWAVITVLLAVLVWQKRAWQGTLKSVQIIQPLSWIEKVMLLGIVSIVLAVGFIAAWSAPNTWDSMTYHLSRVMHWIQNQTLAHYPSHIPRQLAYAPFPEMVILHSMLLTGQDYLANFVQFFSMIGSWVVISLIASALGANRQIQLITVFLAATIPMGILQGSSTQTDYLAAFWIAVFVYQAVLLTRQFTWERIIWAGISLGLGLLTKGHVYIYAVIPCMVIAAAAIYPWKFKKIVMVVLMVLIAFLLNSGYFMRNMQHFGTCFGPADPVVSAQVGVKETLGNLMRNAGVNLSSPFMTIDKKADEFYSGLVSAVDSSKQPFDFSIRKEGVLTDEDYAGNLLHMVGCGIVFLLGVLLFRKNYPLMLYLGALAGITVIFSMTISWQPWITRFHLPFFVLFCVAGGLVLGYFKKPVIMAVLCVFYIGAQPWVWNGSPRSLWGKESILNQSRDSRYFLKKKYLEHFVIDVSKHIQASGCRQVGFFLGADDWEYPWWVFLKRNNYQVRLEHIATGSDTYPLGDFEPCIILSTQGNEKMVYRQGSYLRALEGVGWSVLLRVS